MYMSSIKCRTAALANKNSCVGNLGVGCGVDFLRTAAIIWPASMGVSMGVKAIAS